LPLAESLSSIIPRTASAKPGSANQPSNIGFIAASPSWVIRSVSASDSVRPSSAGPMYCMYINTCSGVGLNFSVTGSCSTGVIPFSFGIGSTPSLGASPPLGPDSWLAQATARLPTRIAALSLSGLVIGIRTPPP
jgi:hypothetical protein